MVTRNGPGRRHLSRRKGSIVNNEQNSIASGPLDKAKRNVKGGSHEKLSNLVQWE